MRFDSRWLGMILIGLMLSLAVACGGKTKSSSQVTPVQLGVLSSVAGITVFAQRVPVEDSGTIVAPGQPNCWDLLASFALESGCAAQLGGALVLTIDAGSGTVPFPNTGTYSGLDFYGPELNRADGVTVAVVDSDVSNATSGSYSAVLTGTHDSSIRQTIQLLSATTPILLTYEATVEASLGNITGDSYHFTVEVRDSAGFRTELYSETDTGTTGTLGTYDLSAFAGEQIYLYFRQRSAAWNASWIDDVSIQDDDSKEYVTNGGFESGSLSGWSTGSIETVRNVTTSVNTVAGLDVTRSFFSPPGAKWGRWVDVFVNNSGATINATMTYSSSLGAGAYGIIYDTPGTAGGAVTGAVTAWDGDNRVGQQRVRDVGFVFGTPDSVSYTTDTAMGAGAGTNSVVAEFDVSLLDGETAALANFVVMNAVTTGDAAGSASEMASAIDTEALRIWLGYPTTASVNEFTNGMTQAQLDAVANF